MVDRRGLRNSEELGDEPTLFVRAIYAYNGADTSSLSFRKGDSKLLKASEYVLYFIKFYHSVIEVITRLESGWWDGMIVPAKERGWFPSNYVTQLSDAEATWAREQLEAEEVSVREEDGIRGDVGQTRHDAELENVLWKGLNGLGMHTQLEDDEDLSFSEGGAIFAEIAGAAASSANDELSSDDAMESDSPSAVKSKTESTNTFLSDTAEDYWIPRVTQDGQIFYYNSRTGQTSRDMPLDIEAESVGMNLANSSDSTVPRISESSESFESLDGLGGLKIQTSASQKLKRPSDAQTDGAWIQKTLDDGQTKYYENRITGERRWSPPNPATQSQQMSNNYSASSTDVESPVITSRPPTALAPGEDPRMSIYSDDSAMDTGLQTETRKLGSKSSGSFHKGNRNDLFLQSHTGTSAFKSLDPPSATALADLETHANDAIAELIDCAHPRRIRRRRDAEDPAALDLELEGDRDRLAALTLSVVNEIRILMHDTDGFEISSTKGGPFRNDNAAVTASAQQAAELRPYTRKITSTLSKLVLSVRAVWGLMSTSELEEAAIERSYVECDSDFEIENLRQHRADVLRTRQEAETKLRWDIVDGAREVSEAVVKLIEELERISAQATIRSEGSSHPSPKHNQGYLHTSATALLLPTGGCGGNWRGNGFANVVPNLTNDRSSLSSLSPSYLQPSKPLARSMLPRLTELCKSLHEETSALRTVITQILSKASKRASTASTRSDRSRPVTPNMNLVASTPLQTAARHLNKLTTPASQILTSISALLALVDDIDIAERVDLDIEPAFLPTVLQILRLDNKGKGSEEPASEAQVNDYQASLDRARTVLGDLESQKQLLYDSGPSLILLTQAIATNSCVEGIPDIEQSTVINRSEPVTASPLVMFSSPLRDQDPLASLSACLNNIDRGATSIIESFDDLCTVADIQNASPKDLRRAHQKYRVQLIENHQLAASDNSGTIAALASSSEPHSTPLNDSRSTMEIESIGSDSRRDSYSMDSLYNSKRSRGGHPVMQSGMHDPGLETVDSRFITRDSMADSLGSTRLSVQSELSMIRRESEMSGNRVTQDFNPADSPTNKSLNKSKLEKLLGVTGVPISIPSGQRLPNREETPSFLGPDYEFSEVSYNIEAQIKGGTLSALVALLTSHESGKILLIIFNYNTHCRCS